MKAYQVQENFHDNAFKPIPSDNNECIHFDGKKRFPAFSRFEMNYKHVIKALQSTIKAHNLAT